MKKDNKIYNRIMESIAKEVKKALNEEEKELTPGEKMDAWHNGERDENIKACSADKLKKYKAICKSKGYDAEVAAIQAEIDKRGLKESRIFEGEFANAEITEQYGAEFAELVSRVLSGGPIDDEKDSETVFDALVPSMGNADTLGGELMRAAMRIAYRYWNDGDCAGEGYGRETVNPAVRFLDARVRPCKSSTLRNIVDKLMVMVDRGCFGTTDKEYEQLTKDLLKETVRYIVINRSWNATNNEDMFDFKNKKLDVDRDEDWEDEDW